MPIRQQPLIAKVNSKYIPRKATTGFYPNSDILISRELNINSTIPELTSILLHEIGHHLGHHDENELAEPDFDTPLLLDKFAEELVKAAISISDGFRNKIEGRIQIVVIQNTDKSPTLDINRRAHSTVWSTLSALIPSNSVYTFNMMGEISVFKVLERSNDSKVDQMQLAVLIDSIFRNIRWAELEYGVSDPVLHVYNTLAQANSKNVVWFADRMDEIYHFLGE
ncbi:MAG: hypothetical protein AABZ06_01125 [Bdellovibrionota bacterium]|mgnify:FL=1